jgi:hypothetical protein
MTRSIGAISLTALCKWTLSKAAPKGDACVNFFYFPYSASRFYSSAKKRVNPQSDGTPSTTPSKCNRVGVQTRPAPPGRAFDTLLTNTGARHP